MKDFMESIKERHCWIMFAVAVCIALAVACPQCNEAMERGTTARFTACVQSGQAWIGDGKCVGVQK